MPGEVIIFNEGDPSASAYIIKNSPLYFESAHVPRIALKMHNLLCGVTELFLAEKKKIPPRLFTLSVEPSGEVKTLSFSAVLELARKYEYGFSVNRLLAVLIDRTNEQLQQAIQKLPADWQQYRELATLFADIVNRVAKVADTERVSDYARLAGSGKKSKTYRDGTQFREERIIARIQYNSTFEGSAVRFLSDSRICHLGDRASCIYLLLEGAVYVSRVGRILATISHPGECFGELAFFLRGRRTADLVASPGTAILKINKNNLREFHEHHPEMFINIAETLARRLRQNMEGLAYYNSAEPVKRANKFEKLAVAAKKEINELVETLKAFTRVAYNRELSIIISSAASNKILRK